MNEDLEQYILIRCDKALMGNDEYKDLQRQSIEAFRKKDIMAYSDINTSLHILIEKVCYQACAQDILNTISELKQ